MPENVPRKFMSGSSEGSVPSDGKKVSRRKQGNATANTKRLDISLGYLNNKLEKGWMGLFVLFIRGVINLLLLFKRFRIPKGKIEMIGYDGVSRDFECIGNFPSICFSTRILPNRLEIWPKERLRKRRLSITSAFIGFNR